MARLHEYQGKALLAGHGIAVPVGTVARSGDEAHAIASRLGGRCIVKMQAWTTNRKALGGVVIAESAAAARDAAAKMLAMRVGSFPVTEVLVEEMIPIERELFVSVFIDDRERAPAMLISLEGGSGIEERAKEAGAGGEGKVRRFRCGAATGPARREIDAFLGSSALPAAQRGLVADVAVKLFAVAKATEARSLEINPLVLTKDGRVVAADCRVTVDDYAVFRHPELGIEIARELDHPPTALERVAYRIEQEDHRGTFFFAQMNAQGAPSAPAPPPDSGTSPAGSGGGATESAGGTGKGLIGFHGAGGGGSMMSMDAITAEGFTIANFCDTSGNPSPAKVYRAARVILSQPGLLGYFGSGSGVANQEQYWSAYGLAKAFWEMNLDIPAVIRLGGNTEDRAVEILQSIGKDVPAKVEGYKKTDPPAKIAARFAVLVSEAGGKAWKPREPRRPVFVGAKSSVSFPVKLGRVWIDPAAWKTSGAAIVSRANGFLRDDGGKPALTVTPEEFLAKDSEMIACEVECRRDGVEGIFVELDMPSVS